MIYINIIIPAKPFLQPLQVYKVALYALGFTDGLDGKESACNAGDPGSISGSGRSLGGGHGNPLQYSCLENPHRQRWLAGYSSWGRKESNMTEWLSTHTHTQTHTHTISPDSYLHTLRKVLFLMPTIFYLVLQTWKGNSVKLCDLS